MWTTVRRAGWRAVRPVTARSTALSSTAPVRSRTTHTVADGSSGRSRAVSHMRCWPGDRRAISAPTARGPSAASAQARARARGVGFSHSAPGSGRARCSAERSRPSSTVASRDEPPSPKKSSSGPTSAPSSSDMSAAIRPARVRGGGRSGTAGLRALRSAVRSILPLPVTGRRSWTTTSAGTITAGSTSRSSARIATASTYCPGAGTTCATICRPGPAPATTAALVPIAGRSVSTRSISARSTRTPLILIW